MSDPNTWAISSMVEQAPLKRKVTSSSLVWPKPIFALLPLLFASSAGIAAGVKTPAAPQEFEVPKGTVMAVELVDPISSGKNKSGDLFRARVNDGIWVQGKQAVPPGSTMRGRIIDATPSGRVKGQAHLAITLETLELDGSTYTVHAETLSYTGEEHTGKHFGSSLMGALQGALYGVLFGGKTGAIFGAGAGAAAGTAGSIFKGKLDVEYPQGSRLMFETLEPFRVPEPLMSAPVAPAPMKEGPKPAVKPAS